MSIEELLAGTPHRWARGGGDLEVADVTHDSRKVGPGVVFVAIRGARTDGLRFAPEALSRGAAAVVVGRGRSDSPDLAVAHRVIEVDDERKALAVMSRALHGRVDERMTIVGVTGTNGKTTTCSVLARILESGGTRCGTLGTVAYSLGDEEIAAERTTPEAPDVHRYLERMHASGCTTCVMEVSSHALALSRVHGMRFATAVFTNLTRDHLDFHGDMESYFSTKRLLFDGLEPDAIAVINKDDPYGGRLAADLAARAGAAGSGPVVVTYGEAPGSTVRIASLNAGARGISMTLEGSDGRHRLESPLLGRPNGYNVTAAATAASAMGVAWEAIARGAAAATGAPGRMERVGGRGFEVIVDYAHTDDALRGLLETVRQMTRGRVLIVFGCGGDRDRTKRPLMGRHAARLADLVWVTSDNPRGEKPEAILEEILSGIPQSERVGGRIQADPDRRRAIEAAVAAARAGDTVVIAGKGHETYQIVGDRVTPFDDRAVARAALERRGDDETADGTA